MSFCLVSWQNVQQCLSLARRPCNLQFTVTPRSLTARRHRHLSKRYSKRVHQRPMIAPSCVRRTCLVKVPLRRVSSRCPGSVPALARNPYGPSTFASTYERSPSMLPNHVGVSSGIIGKLVITPNGAEFRIVRDICICVRNVASSESLPLNLSSQLHPFQHSAPHVY